MSARFVFALAGLALLAGFAFIPSCAVIPNPQPLNDYIGPSAPTQPTPRETPGTIPPAGSMPATQLGSTEPVTTQPSTQPYGPLNLTVSQAILMALRNNEGLAVQKFNPLITQTNEVTQAAAFDPDFNAIVSGSRSRTDLPVDLGDGNTVKRSESASAALTQFFPTGTTVGLTGNFSIGESSSTTGDIYSPTIGLTATQSLLRGFGLNVNLATLRQARLSTKISQYQLRGFAENLVSQVEQTYWDYALAQRQIEIFEQSLKIAQAQLDETNERIRIGKLADIERAASEAQVALRHEDLIDAESNLQKTRLRLLQLLSPNGGSAFWNRDIITHSPTQAPEVAVEAPEPHVQLAMAMRPDLNEARLQYQSDELQIVKTRNGLLPKMDLFINLGKTGYGDSFGESLRNVTGGQSNNLTVGLNMEYPPLNRAATAADQSAHLSRDQQLESIKNLSQLAELDVRTAMLEVNRLREQVSATAVTRRLQEETLRAEMEKFRVGKSTTLLVGQAQRDLLSSQITEIQAVVNYLKAFADLYRLEGTLLERRGITCPGRKPVDIHKPEY